MPNFLDTNMIITGSKGFIGSRLKAKFPDAIGLDIADGQNILTCDLPDTDIIYHFAAQSSVEESWKDPVHDCDNLKMVVRLVKRYPNAKIVFAQSGSMMDVSSPYSFSKKVSGDYLKKFHSNYVICVFPNVYGGGQRSVVDIFNGKDEVTIFGDGEQVRDFVHVDDIIEGLVLAKDWWTGEYFMGSGKGTKINELARHKKKIHYAPARKEQRESILPNTTPNWKPMITLPIT